MNFLLDNKQLKVYLKEKKIPSFRAKQISQAIYKESLLDIQEITTLSKELRNELEKDSTIHHFDCIETVEGPETTKFLFKLPSGEILETVLMYHRHQKDESKTKDRKILRSWTKHNPSPETHKLNRITICISSQVGCAVGCIFCVTGKMGFKKNLSRQEIIMQILYANNYVKQKFGKKEDGEYRKVRNVVFMGMGEPMLNYDNMVKSIEVMLDQSALSLGRRHITISTSGVVSGIDKLVEDKVPVKLALSLHSPNQKLREKLIPMIAKRRNIDKLMASVDKYVEASGNRLFYEYIMIKDMTDTDALAHELGELLKGRLAHVNLIPYNENPAMPDLETSSFKQIIRFKKLAESHGITVTVRDTLGRNTKGACGQLGYEVIMKQRIEDMEGEEIAQ